MLSYFALTATRGWASRATSGVLRRAEKKSTLKTVVLSYCMRVGDRNEEGRLWWAARLHAEM